MAQETSDMGGYLSHFRALHPDGAGTKVLASVYGFEAVTRTSRRADAHRAG
jgi:hypothetical protein